MSHSVTWQPEQYVLGNYFQTEVNELFRKSFPVQPFGAILDIGSGDGEYSRLLADRLRRGRVLGIDSSVSMVEHANQHWASKNLSFAVHSIEEFQCSSTFDFVLSFWCLHWTAIELSFPNMFHALKTGGRVYAVFSSFSDNSLLQTWHELAKKGPYTELAIRCINEIKPYADYFYRVLKILLKISCKHFKLELNTVSIAFPSLIYFKNLLLTMPFMQTVPAPMKEALIETMLEAFQKICQRKYGSKLYYETRPIFLEAIK